MAFEIKLLEASVGISETSDEMIGEITIDDFRESFSVSIGYWSKYDYIKQWEQALRTLIEAPDNMTSALVSDMHDPASANFIVCWPLYKQGKCVYIRNQILFLDQLPHPFDIENIGMYVENRTLTTADGEQISEWETTKNDLESFLGQ